MKLGDARALDTTLWAALPVPLLMDLSAEQDDGPRLAQHHGEFS
jgi:hypothetical protein